MVSPHAPPRGVLRLQGAADPRPLAGYRLRRTVPHGGLHPRHLRSPGSMAGRKAPQGKQNRRTGDFPDDRSGTVARRNTGHRLRPPRQLAADRPVRRHPLSRMGTRPGPPEGERIQVPDRRPYNPHPHSVGRGCQPHLERRRPGRRTADRGLPAAPHSRAPLAQRRYGHSRLLAPFGAEFRSRRIPRPEVARRLGRRHAAARDPAPADQRHHDDPHLGGLLPLQRQLDLRAAPAVHPADRGRRRGG